MFDIESFLHIRRTKMLRMLRKHLHNLMGMLETDSWNTFLLAGYALKCITLVYELLKKCLSIRMININSD